MKVLVSTKKTQGYRANDFNFTKNKEMVIFPALQCTGEKVDGECGCARSLCGLFSAKGTTTFMVAEKQMKIKEFENIIYKQMRKFWKSTTRIAAKELVKEILSVTKRFPVGAILERRGKIIRLRPV